MGNIYMYIFIYTVRFYILALLLVRQQITDNFIGISIFLPTNNVFGQTDQRNKKQKKKKKKKKKNASLSLIVKCTSPFESCFW